MSFNPFNNPQDAATLLNALANLKTADMTSMQAQLSAEQLKQLQLLQQKSKSEQKRMAEDALKTLFKCPACDGSGKSNKCQTCEGRGVFTETNMPYKYKGKLSARMFPCWDCNGTGGKHGSKCYTCQGTGETNKRDRLSFSGPIYECPDCNGRGASASPGGYGAGGYTPQCTKCKGDGIDPARKHGPDGYISQNQKLQMKFRY